MCHHHILVHSENSLLLSYLKLNTNNLLRKHLVTFLHTRQSKLSIDNYLLIVSMSISFIGTNWCCAMSSYLNTYVKAVVSKSEFNLFIVDFSIRWGNTQNSCYFVYFKSCFAVPRGLGSGEPRGTQTFR